MNRNVLAVLFEDPKASGFEPVEVRSGYNGNEMHADVEFRDERVAFFVRALARGQHSLSYRLRAERNPRQVQRTADEGFSDVRAGTQSQLGRNQAGD